MCFFLQTVTILRSSAALPYDCMMDRLSCLFVPDDGCLSLVRNTDCCNVLCFCPNHVHCFNGYTKHTCPDLICIMFNPARFREILCEFPLCNAAHFSFFIEQDTSVTCCSRIQCHYILSHTLFSSFKIKIVALHVL